MPNIQEQPRRQPPLYPYALIEIVGTLTKGRMVQMREQIAAAAASDLYGSILLLVDSPGGTVAGVHDLYLTISAAAQRKRVVAVIEDMACSGALYVIAGASEIVIGETSLTGSIGVYQVVFDESKLLEKIGIDVLVVRAGNHKGAGEKGVKLTPEQLAEIQRRVDVQARHFIASVAKGRKMTVQRVTDLADGRVFIGQEALAAGLADRVGMFEDIEAEMRSATVGLMYRELHGHAAVRQLDELVASEERDTKSPAAECRERILSQYTALASAVATVEQEQAAAKAAEEEKLAADKKRWEEHRRYKKQIYGRQMNAGQSSNKEKRMSTNNETDDDAPKKRGTEPIGGGMSDDASDDWEGLAPNEFARLKIDERVAKGMNRDRAARSVFQAYPNLREAMIEEANDRPQRRR